MHLHSPRPVAQCPVVRPARHPSGGARHLALDPSQQHARLARGRIRRLCRWQSGPVGTAPGTKGDRNGPCEASCASASNPGLEHTTAQPARATRAPRWAQRPQRGPWRPRARPLRLPQPAPRSPRAGNRLLTATRQVRYSVGTQLHKEGTERPGARNRPGAEHGGLLYRP